MNDCFVTELKKSFNDNNFRKLGVISIPVLPMSSPTNLHFSSMTTDAVASIFNENDELVKSVHANANHGDTTSYFRLKNGGRIEYSDKYNLITLSSINFDAKTAKAAGRDIDELPKFEEYKYMNYITKMDGGMCCTDIANLATLNSLTNISAEYMYGDIINYVNTKKALGYNTGEITFSNYASSFSANEVYITFNGCKCFCTSYGSDANHPNALHWDDDKIWLRTRTDGQSCVYGYTDAEIQDLFDEDAPFEHQTKLVKVDSGTRVTVNKV